jgi:hypothetical protein
MYDLQSKGKVCPTHHGDIAIDFLCFILKAKSTCLKLIRDERLKQMPEDNVQTQMMMEQQRK